MQNFTTTKDYLADKICDFFADYDPYDDDLNDVSFIVNLLEKAPKELIYMLQQIADALENEQDEMLQELAERAKNIGLDLQDFVGMEPGTEVALDDIIELETDEKKPRLFVDMDGTLAKFNNQISSEEQLYEKGYFFNLEPQMDVVDAIRDIIKEDKMEVFALSAVLTDSLYALNEKNEWLDKYLPELGDDRRVFSPVGQEKALHIPNGIQQGDILLDDYSKNLHEWPKDGLAIKLMNGINGTKGTWKGPSVDLFSGAKDIKQGIESLVFGAENEPERRAVAKNKDVGFDI